MKTLSVGIIGFGLSGAIFHAPIIQAVSGFRIAAITSSRIEKIKIQCPKATIYADAISLISNPFIDLVIITTPNESHYSLAKQALEHNKHVVVEKPFVLNSHEGQQLIILAQSKNLVLSVYHNRRWDNDFIALKQAISAQILGDISQCEIRFERFRPQVASERWREQALPGSGLLYDLGSHLIDQALQLFGWPNTVYADIASQRTSAIVDDYFHLLLGYPALKVILHVGSLVKKSGPRFLVHGSKGSFMKYGLDPQERLLLAMVNSGAASIYRKTLHKDQDSQRRNICDNWIEVCYEENDETISQQKDLPMGDYRQYYRQLYDCIVHQQATPVSAQSALDCIRLIEYAHQSYAENKMVLVGDSVNDPLL